MPRSLLLRGATLLHLDPPAVEIADLRLSEGQIAAVGPDLAPAPEDEVLSLPGAWIMPGLVCAHTHLYSALSCGMPLPATEPRSFADMLDKVWWRLDRALDADSIELSGLVGGVAALQAGVTTVVDHHASPSHIQGSLELLDGALAPLGLRRVLCYEVTDRGGPARAAAGLAAHEALLAAGPRPDRAVMVGAHASFTLSDATLARCAGLAREAGVGLHIHVAEAPDDALLTGEPVVARLARLGALLPGSLLAHCVHLSEDELARVADAGAWVSVQPRSNQNNQVGFAPVGAMGPRLALGTDGIGADLFAELQAGWYRGREARLPWGPDRWLGALTGGARMASAQLGLPLGQLCPGAGADLVVLDAPPGPPITAENLAASFVFRFSAATVRHVMVGGRWRLWDRAPTAALGDLDRRARAAASALWARMAALPAGLADPG